MGYKICKACKSEKKVDLFYRSQVYISHVGERRIYYSSCCKECAIKNQKGRPKKEKSIDGILKERSRQRESKKIVKKRKVDKNVLKEYYDRHKNKYPEKAKARQAVSNAKIKPKIKGNQIHHWNYNSEYHLDIIELTKEIHYKLHRYLKYDENSKTYFNIWGFHLDTKEKHLKFIDEVIKIEEKPFAIKINK